VDSFEPSQGRFEFEWFDKIMDKMQANRIRVILDIPGLPAPIWLHRRYRKSISLTSLESAVRPRSATWMTSAILTMRARRQFLRMR